MGERPHLCDCDSEQCHTPYYNRLCHEGDECIHVDGTRHKISPKGLLRVSYKFKDENESITITVNEQQYFNLLEVSAIEKCEIIGPAQKPISKEEKERFNQKIIIACRQDTGHTKYLLQ